MSWRYLSGADVVHINERITGSADMLTAPLLLASAVHRQWAGFGETELYPDIHQKAGALFHGLCVNHVFIDGNKRTAFMAADALCRLNGARVAADVDHVVALAVDTAGQSLPVEVVIKRFAAIVVSQPSPTT